VGIASSLGRAAEKTKDISRFDPYGIRGIPAAGSSANVSEKLPANGLSKTDQRGNPHRV